MMSANSSACAMIGATCPSLSTSTADRHDIWVVAVWICPARSIGSGLGTIISVGVVIRGSSGPKSRRFSITDLIARSMPARGASRKDFTTRQRHQAATG